MFETAFAVDHKPLSILFCLIHSVESPSTVDPSGIYGIEGPSEICTQSAEVRLAVSGAQPLFTLGLLMFALSLVDFLSLLLSPSTYFKIFYFCQKYHLKDTYKIFKKFHVGLKFEWGLQDQNWVSCERLPFEVFFSCFCDGHLGIAYANMLATTQWPLERAAHLTCLGLCSMAAWKLKGPICAM